MTTSGGTWLCFALLLLLPSSPVLAADTPVPPPGMHDGRHDFDFGLGVFATHIKRLTHPLTGSTTWTEWNGTVTTRKVWAGRANLEELEVDGPAAHLEGLTLRLYNPTARQWNLYWASSSDGTLGHPLTGEFKDGRGEFYDQELYNGKAILVKNVYSAITADSYHFEQAFSADGGRSWEPNWVADLNRVSPTEVPLPTATSSAGGQRDFDFNIGAWQTHISRLMNSSSGSKTWGDYAGTHVVHKVWGGRANLGELEVDGPTGHIEDLALRLYNPGSQQWNVYLASSKSGVLGDAMVGGFKDGRGEFIYQDEDQGRTVLVRDIWSDIKADSCRNEWADSEDGGKTWETNWVAVDTLIK
jgi:hypothetical protein